MRMLTKLLLPAVLLCVSATAAASDRFSANDGRHRDSAAGGNLGNLLVVQNDGPTLGEAVEQVRRQYNGRIVSAETRISGKREVHHIKVLTEDGKVKTVEIPGRTRRSE
ncbi:MAG: hypothetical protein WD795_14590 [Woeseia sp.]